MANMKLEANKELPPEDDVVEEGKDDDDVSSNVEYAAELTLDVNVDKDSEDAGDELRGAPQVDFMSTAGLDQLRSRQQFEGLTRKYEQVCKKLREAEASIVGLTTTGGAENREMLRSLDSDVVIVEEAAEALKGHVLACLSTLVKDLVLIGDRNLPTRSTNSQQNTSSMFPCSSVSCKVE